MGSSLNLLKEYCRNASDIGTIAPDSKNCVNSLLRLVPFDSAKVIVEFGSASGAVTREIIKRKRAETILVSFEKNPNLYAELQSRVYGRNVILLNEDVFNCAKALDLILGLKGRNVDCIVSTLPCSSIDFDFLMQHSVLPVLKYKGCFVQYMHTLSLLKGFSLKDCLAQYFNKMVSDYVLFNIPPSLIYSCSNDKLLAAGIIKKEIHPKFSTIFAA